MRFLVQVPAEEDEKLQQLLRTHRQAGQQTLYHLPHMNLWTKLRPGVHVRTPITILLQVVTDLPAHTLLSVKACFHISSGMWQPRYMA